MGLDMYLSATRGTDFEAYKTAIKAFNQRTEADDRAISRMLEEHHSKPFGTVIGEFHGFPVYLQGWEIGDTLNEYASLSIEAVYWRKANAIHKYFVDTVQGGEDDCGMYPVTKAQLEQLSEYCQQAFDEKDETILPPQSGFFFGSTDIDESYWGELLRTSIRIDELLEIFDFDKGIVFYESSW